MILDIIGIALIILLFARGYRKGIIVAAFSLLGMILGVICAMKLSGKLAAWLMGKGIVTSSWGLIVSYLILFFGVVLLLRLGARILERSARAVWLGGINKLTGGILYALIGAFVWSTCLWIGNHAHLFTPEILTQSRTYDYYAPIAPWVFANVGAVLPFAKNILGDLQGLFDQVNQKLPEHVGAH